MTAYDPTIPPTLAAAMATPAGRARIHDLLKRAFAELAELLRSDIECVAVLDDGRPRPTLDADDLAYIRRETVLLRELEEVIGRQEVKPDWVRAAIDAPERLASPEAAA